MRSDAFDQQRELRMKEGVEGRGGGRRGKEGFGDESCAEDGHDMTTGGGGGACEEDDADGRGNESCGNVDE